MYNDEMKCSVSPIGVNEPVRELFAPLLNEVSCKAVEALSMTRHINNAMFGRNEQTAGKEAEPRCAMDLLINHNICLSELCKELKLIIDRLGV
jgi:hypothetical protein